MKRHFGSLPKKLLPLMIITLAIVMLMSVGAVAEPTIYVESGQPDENGLFEVSVSAENTEFLIYQLAFRYNTDVVVPVDENGNQATSFADFAVKQSVRSLASIGEKLDAEKGVFLFTQYCIPGTSENKMIHISDKTELYRFSFRKIADGEAGFDIASIFNGDVYDELFPDGAVFFRANDERYICKVKFVSGETVRETETVRYRYDELYPRNLTKEQRLAGTVYVVDKDYAAAVGGVLAAIDPENRLVVPYKKDGVRYYPLRFICEALGFEVGWNGEKEIVTVSKNGKTVEFEAVADGKSEIVESRTMVTGELLCEITGARIYEYAGGGSVVYDAIPEWTPDRQAEKDALNAMQYVMMPFFRIFI